MFIYIAHIPTMIISRVKFIKKHLKYWIIEVSYLFCGQFELNTRICTMKQQEQKFKLILCAIKHCKKAKNTQ